MSLSGESKLIAKTRESCLLSYPMPGTHLKRRLVPLSGVVSKVSFILLDLFESSETIQHMIRFKMPFSKDKAMTNCQNQNIIHYKSLTKNQTNPRNTIEP